LIRGVGELEHGRQILFLFLLFFLFKVQS